MKLGNKVLEANVVVIPIPRGMSEDIVFKAAAITSMETFDKILPAPKPKTKVLPSGQKSENRNDPAFKDAMKEYTKARLSWMVLESLKATPDLTWDTIDPDQPHTWANYEKELRDAGFSEMELVRIVQGVMDANCLNEELINESRKRFLSPVQPDEQSQSPTDEAQTSQS